MNEQVFNMRPFFEMTPDLVFIVGKDGFIRKVNQAVIAKLGYSEEELFASPVSEFIHADDKELTARKRSKLLNGNALLNFQNRYITRNGKIIWLDWTSIYFAEKEVVFAIAKDVTKRKWMEKEIEERYAKFKGLATHFKNSVERVRKSLAAELHEEIAQMAAVVKMDMNWLKSNTPDLPAPARSRLEHALIVADLLVNAVQRISFSISPGMLEELGLNETLKWLCDEFTILNEIPCRFEYSYDEGHLSQEIKMDFFRICQESLRNVMYHARANSVKVNIEERKGKICLSITDDGKGFEVQPEKRATGLVEIRERAASINGELIIESRIGKGTRIAVTVAQPFN